MAKIHVYTNEIDSLSTRLKKISSVISDSEQLVANVQRNLDFQVSAKADIESSLLKIRKGLKKQNEKMGNLSKLAAASGEEFKTADNQMGKKAQSVIEKIKSSITGLAHSVKNFLASIHISRHKEINDIFLSTGSGITIASIRGLMQRLNRNGNVGSEYDGGSGLQEEAQATTSKAVGGANAETVAAQKKTSMSQPTVVNTGSSVDNAKNAGITYYAQTQRYNKYWNENVWKGNNGVNYANKANLACGICCDAMIASYFGVSLTPGQLLEANGGYAAWDGSGVKNLMKKYGFEQKRIDSQNGTLQEKVSCLDDYLTKYQSDPGNNAPPMVKITMKNSPNHYVLVLGKDQNGDYIIVDPNLNKRTILKRTEGTVAESGTSYESPIKGVFTWAKR